MNSKLRILSYTSGAISPQFFSVPPTTLSLLKRSLGNFKALQTSKMAGLQKKGKDNCVHDLQPQDECGRAYSLDIISNSQVKERQ